MTTKTNVHDTRTDGVSTNLGFTLSQLSEIISGAMSSTTTSLATIKNDVALNQHTSGVLKNSDGSYRINFGSANDGLSSSDLANDTNATIHVWADGVKLNSTGFSASEISLDQLKTNYHSYLKGNITVNSKTGDLNATNLTQISFVSDSPNNWAAQQIKGTNLNYNSTTGAISGSATELLNVKSSDGKSGTYLKLISSSKITLSSNSTTPTGTITGYEFGTVTGLDSEGDPTFSKVGANSGLSLSYSNLATQGLAALDNSIYAGNDTLTGTTGDDYINAGLGNNKITGNGGNDTIIATTGNDTVIASTGNDSITAGSGNNSIVGGGGNDTISSGADNDTISTGNGNDNISAGNGNNNITDIGGTNNILSGSGNDQITTGSGNDYIDAGDGKNSITDTGGSNNIWTGSGNDKITVSGSGNSTVHSGAGNDVIDFSKSTGNNIIYGNDGADTIKGGSGDDYIGGGAGADFLTGGLGKDIFKIHIPVSSDLSVDTITDFVSGTDKLDFFDYISTQSSQNFDSTIFDNNNQLKSTSYKTSSDYAKLSTTEQNTFVGFVYDNKKGLLSYDGSDTTHTLLSLVTLNNKPVTLVGTDIEHNVNPI